MAEPLLYVTFGQKYHREPHPRLPGWACDPDGWLEVVADTEDGATALLIEHVGVLAPGSLVINCAGIYSKWTAADRGYYPKGRLGTISKDGLTRSESDG